MGVAGDVLERAALPLPAAPTATAVPVGEPDRVTTVEGVLVNAGVPVAALDALAPEERVVGVSMGVSVNDAVALTEGRDVCVAASDEEPREVAEADAVPEGEGVGPPLPDAPREARTEGLTANDGDSGGESVGKALAETVGVRRGEARAEGEPLAVSVAEAVPLLDTDAIREARGVGDRTAVQDAGAEEAGVPVGGAGAVGWGDADTQSDHRGDAVTVEHANALGVEKTLPVVDAEGGSVDVGAFEGLKTRVVHALVEGGGDSVTPALANACEGSGETVDMGEPLPDAVSSGVPREEGVA